MFIKFENILFNKDWVASKTYEEFFEHEKHHGLSKEKMREIYDAIKKTKKTDPKNNGVKPD